MTEVFKMKFLLIYLFYCACKMLLSINIEYFFVFIKLNIYKYQLHDQSHVKLGGWGSKLVFFLLFSPFFGGRGQNWGVPTTFTPFFGGRGCLKIFQEAFSRGPPVNFFFLKMGWSCNWLPKKWIKWDIGGPHVNFFFEITYSFQKKAFLFMFWELLFPKFLGTPTKSFFPIIVWMNKSMTNLYFLNIELKKKPFLDNST